MITSIFVLESLNENPKTGFELYEDTIKRYNDFYWQGNEKIRIQYFDVPDKVSLQLILNEIFTTVACGEEIIIHFEMHGLESKTGLLLKNEDIIRWSELRGILIDINRKLINNLNISMATCYGMYLHRILDFRSTAPYKSYISASDIVYPNEIIENYTPYYECLMQHKDVYEAWKCLKQHNSVSKFYIKDTEAQIEFIIEQFFGLHFEENYSRFRTYFLLFFDINLPEKDHELFETTLSEGLRSYQRRFFMRDVL